MTTSNLGWKQGNGAGSSLSGGSCRTAVTPTPLLQSGSILLQVQPLVDWLLVTLVLVLPLFFEFETALFKISLAKADFAGFLPGAAAVVFSTPCQPGLPGILYRRI